MKTESRWITGSFVRFLTGRTLSVLGGNILRFALSLYILEQTGSAAEYGTVLALGYVPTILLSPLGGVLPPMLGSTLYGALGGARLGVLLAVCAALHAGAAGVALTLRIPLTRQEKCEGAGAAVWKVLRLAFVQRRELGRVMLFNALLTLLLNPFLAMGVRYTVSVRLGLPAVWNGTAQSIIGA